MSRKAYRPPSAAPRKTGVARRELDPALAFLDDGAEVSESLRSLWIASGATCWLCETLVLLSEATRDHVIPRSWGGGNGLSNIRLAHRQCNEERADVDLPDEKTAEPEWGRDLVWLTRSRPRKPSRKCIPRKYNNVAKVWEHYRGICFECGRDVPQQDARRLLLVPKHLGGGYAMDNLRLVHAACKQRVIAAEREAQRPESPEQEP